jgi:putative DNA primase/helicase
LFLRSNQGLRIVADVYTFDQARAQLGREADRDDDHTRSRDSDDRPTIKIAKGQLPRMVDQSQRALIDTAAGIYQRAGLLVRISILESPERAGGVARPAGSAVITPVTKEYLTLALARAAQWRKFDARAKDWIPADPPSSVSASLLSASGEWLFPELRGVVSAPTLRSVGTVLQVRGFDAASGLYFFDDGTNFPEISAHPTRVDALDALAEFDRLIEEFEFEGGTRGAHASAAIAASVTACLRHALSTAPGFGLNAHKAGSGKTTLGHTIARIATGRDAAVMPLDGDESEVRKVLLAVLLAADLIVLIDNVSGPVDSAALCAALTSAVYKDRVLGVSRTVSVPTAATFLFNGNNLEFIGDLTSRIMLCTLDPQCEQPEARPFRRDITAYVSEHRGELVKAALTIPLAYLSAGEPQVSAVPSRFRDWDRFVRLPLLWLKCADPLDTQAELRASDPVREGLVAVLQAWESWQTWRLPEAIADMRGAATVAEVVKAATTLGQGTVPHQDQLREALVGVAGERDGSINAKRLGRYLTRNLRRIEKGLRFEEGEQDLITHRRRFKVASVTGVSGVYANPSRDIADNSDSRAKANADNTDNGDSPGSL